MLFFSKLSHKFLLTILFNLCFFTTIAQFNVAPAASISANSCLAAPCTNINNQDVGVCGVFQVQIGTANPPDTTPGVNWLEWHWPFDETFDKMVIHHAHDDMYSLTGATIQYHDGNTWQNHFSFANLPQQCIDTINFPVLTTNRMRITSFRMTGIGLTTNPRFREIEIFNIPEINDAGVSDLLEPTTVCTGNEDVVVRVRNYGSNQINSLSVNWSVNGVLQSPIAVSTLIDTTGGLNPSFIDVNLGSVNFVANQTYAIQAWTSLPNGQPDPKSVNDTLFDTIIPDVSGSYTINSAQPTGGNNFTSFTDFANFINSRTICGPVVVDVTPNSGPYIERIIFYDIDGSSDTNTITINGNGNVITNHGTNTATRNTISMNWTKYMHIDSLQVIATGPAFGWALYLGNGTRYNTFTNCHFESDINATHSTNVSCVITGGFTSMGTGMSDCRYLNFDNCKFVGGFYGITISGTDINTPRERNSITNCTFEDQRICAIYLRSQDSLIVTNNEITRNNRTDHSNFVALELRDGIYNSEISNNIVHDIYNPAFSGGNATFNGISLNNATGNATNPSIISNNLIYNVHNLGGVFAVRINGQGNHHWKFYHNTIIINQPDSVANSFSLTRMAYFSGPQENFDMRNNIFYLDRPNSVNRILEVAHTNNIDFVLDNNVYYSPHINSMDFGQFGSTLYPTFSDWQTSGLDSNSRFFDPAFVDILADLHPTAFAISQMGANVFADVPADLNGNPRTTSPDPGVYQFNPLSCQGIFDLAIDTLFPGGVELSWQSDNSITAWEVEWDTCGFTPGQGQGNLDSLVTTNSNYLINIPMNQCVCVYVREKCASGGHSPWSDSLQICIPLDHDAELLSLVYPVNITCGDSMMPIKVEIRNNGYIPITSLPVSATISGDISQTLNSTYTGNLQENEVDTFTVGFINSYNGGVINVEAHLSLPNDPIPDNDSVQKDSLHILPFQPLVNGLDYCSSDTSVSVIAPHIPSLDYQWFDSPTGGTSLGVSDTLVVAPQIGSVFVEYLIIQDSLTSTFQGGSGCQQGNMFDLELNTPLNITGFTIVPRVNQVNFPVAIWIVEGGYQGVSQADWNLVVMDTIAQVNVLTPIRYNLPNVLSLDTGITYGIYMQYNAIYTVGTDTFSNNEMTLMAGTGLCSPFVGTAPRIWNGTIHYENDVCSDIRTEVVFNELLSAEADFTWSTISHTVEFQNTSAHADSVRWDFAGLGTATGNNVSFQFPQTDSFQVCLTAYSECAVDVYCENVWADNISVQGFGELTDLRIFPNPNQGNFTLIFSQEEKADVQIEIIDLSGRVVLNRYFTNHQGEFEQMFDVAHLAAGMYKLRLRSGSGNVIRSFIVK
jgi:hypothetical protein